jgi:hypothetical protein
LNREDLFRQEAAGRRLLRSPEWWEATSNMLTGNNFPNLRQERVGVRVVNRAIPNFGELDPRVRSYWALRSCWGCLCLVQIWDWIRLETRLDRRQTRGRRCRWCCRSLTCCCFFLGFLK